MTNVFSKCSIFVLYKHKDMETIISNKNFKVEFNGSATYYLVDSENHCWKTFSTERKAINYFNKLSSNY